MAVTAAAAVPGVLPAVLSPASKVVPWGRVRQIKSISRALNPLLKLSLTRTYHYSSQLTREVRMHTRDMHSSAQHTTRLFLAFPIIHCISLPEKPPPFGLKV